MSELNLDQNSENVEKAANVAQTNYKLRNKKEMGKNMKLDKENVHLLYHIFARCSNNFYDKDFSIRNVNWDENRSFTKYYNSNIE